MKLLLMASSVGLWFWLAPAGCIASHAASLASEVRLESCDGRVGWRSW
jgi:hypothetical protein